MRALTLTISILILAAPLAAAGTKDDPEVKDPAGDCSFAPGNHYLDITSAWISDETASDFSVNIALAEWVAPAAEGAGYAIEFTHQKTQFGVLAGFFGQTWSFGNGDALGDNFTFYPGNGSFQASPPVITVKFEKHYFPHKDMSDNKLVNFVGGSIDAKPDEPAAFASAFVPAPIPGAAFPPVVACDTVQGTKDYTFQAGMHSMAGMSMNETSSASASAASKGTNASAPTPATVVPQAVTQPSKGTPFPTPILVLGLVGALAWARRRSR